MQPPVAFLGCWPEARQSETAMRAIRWFKSSRSFVHAALPSSRAAGLRAPVAVLLGSSCAGNPSSWAWASILSSFLPACWTLVPHPIQNLQQALVDPLALAVSFDSNAKYRSRRPFVKTIDAMLDERPGRGGEQARVSSTRHPFATRALWRCSVVLYGS